MFQRILKALKCPDYNKQTRKNSQKGKQEQKASGDWTGLTQMLKENKNSFLADNADHNRIDLNAQKWLSVERDTQTPATSAVPTDIGK